MQKPERGEREKEVGGWVGGGGMGELCWDPNAPAFVRASKEDISPPPLATQAVPVQEGTAGVSRNGGHSARQTVVLRDYGSPHPAFELRSALRSESPSEKKVTVGELEGIGVRSPFCPGATQAALRKTAWLRGLALHLESHPEKI